jgi:hypothetical protein
VRTLQSAASVVHVADRCTRNRKIARGRVRHRSCVSTGTFAGCALREGPAASTSEVSVISDRSMQDPELLVPEMRSSRLPSDHCTFVTEVGSIDLIDCSSRRPHAGGHGERSRRSFLWLRLMAGMGCEFFLPRTKRRISLRTMSWIRPYWAELCAGKKIEVHFWCHPETLGFQQFALAEDVGQVQNWGLPLRDGSRLHLWLMPDGRWIMHRDATDPGRGLLHAAVHVLTETRVGPALALAGLVIGVGTLVAAAGRA